MAAGGWLLPGGGYTGALERHHVFPKEFRDQFEKLVKIDDHTLEIPDWLHDLLHRGPAGGAWNNAWQQFFDRFAQAGQTPTIADIYDYGLQLINQHGLSGYPATRYRR